MRLGLIMWLIIDDACSHMNAPQQLRFYCSFIIEVWRQFVQVLLKLRQKQSLCKNSVLRALSS